MVDVFNTSNNAYLITIQVPDNSINGGGTPYSINEILNIINSQLENKIANGNVF
jgi:hypothetical protein